MPTQSTFRWLFRWQSTASLAVPSKEKGDRRKKKGQKGVEGQQLSFFRRGHGAPRREAAAARVTKRGREEAEAAGGHGTTGWRKRTALGGGELAELVANHQCMDACRAAEFNYQCWWLIRERQPPSRPCCTLPDSDQLIRGKRQRPAGGPTVRVPWRPRGRVHPIRPSPPARGADPHTRQRPLRCAASPPIHVRARGRCTAALLLLCCRGSEEKKGTHASG